MAIFAETTENECVIERLLRDIDSFANPVLFIVIVYYANKAAQNHKSTVK